VAFSHGSWELRPNFLPILALTYANGVTAGQGYMEVWDHGYQQIGGTKAVRQSFALAAPLTVSTVAVRVKRTSGSAPLVLKIDGTAVGSVDGIPATAPDDRTGAVWAVVPVSLTLPAGSHSLALASTGEYIAICVRKGIDYGYPSSTYYAGGSAEWTADGTTWRGFGFYRNTYTAQGDLQFYVR
jgi:hypothetical protein